ncbi:MAG: HNH endonuclease [Pseudanabaenaceae cyanobacterium]|jgi:hypothetical protein
MNEPNHQLNNEEQKDQLKSIDELFKMADQIGNKRYHHLTSDDFIDYRKYDFWRYIDGDGECGTTDESKAWVKGNSSHKCPICNQAYAERGGKNIDHKLPRAQYPWLSLEFTNLWVICRECNREKSDMHWFEYERYVFQHYPQRYAAVRSARPTTLINDLRNRWI